MVSLDSRSPSRLLELDEINCLCYYLVMSEEVQKEPEFNFPKVISLGSENSNETKKLTAEEQLKKSLLEGTLKTNIRLAPESRTTKNNPENQS